VTLRLLAWLLAVACLAQRYHHGYHSFDDAFEEPAKRRADGNGGHAEIDFGGQWVMGRTVVLGRGREMYDRNRQWELVREAYPRADESAWVRERAFPFDRTLPRYVRDTSPHHDADWMMYWFMGRDSPRWADAGRAVAAPFAAANPFAAAAALDAASAALAPVVPEVSRKAVGGPLYPPVHALLYAPVGLIDRPRDAYRAFQVVCTAVGLLVGLGVHRLSDGRVPWPVATAVVAFYPGFRAGVELSQNPAITLAILVWGWALAARGRDALGGAVWGLLAFKPVWGMAFVLLPLLTGRWRFCLAMVLTGAGLAAATLPAVGLEAWFDWLAVGREAAALYKVNRAWVFLSRDLFGLPRRLMLDFEVPEASRDRPAAEVAGWLLWLAVVGTTAVVFRLRGDRRRATGPGVAFLALGAYLGGYRFMYYDALLSGLAVAILYAGPDRPRAWSVPTLLLAALLVLENVFVERAYGLIGTPLNTGVRWPWDTVILLGLWGWLGRRTWNDRQLTPV
jgi:hypothetical protein